MPKTAISPSQEKHMSGQQGGELGYTVVLEVFSPLGNKVCMLYQLTCVGSPLGEEMSSPGSRHSDGTDPWQPSEEDRGACMSL